jgi:hypothetical protein
MKITKFKNREKILFEAKIGVLIFEKNNLESTIISDDTDTIIALKKAAIKDIDIATLVLNQKRDYIYFKEDTEMYILDQKLQLQIVFNEYLKQNQWLDSYINNTDRKYSLVGLSKTAYQPPTKLVKIKICKDKKTIATFKALSAVNTKIKKLKIKDQKLFTEMLNFHFLKRKQK